MEKKIAVILGDGIGPEVTHQSIKVLNMIAKQYGHQFSYCLLYTSPSPRDRQKSRMPSSA